MPSQILNHSVQRLRYIGIIPPGGAWQFHRFVDEMNIRVLWFYSASFFVFLPQFAFMVLRAADVMEVMHVFFPVVTSLGTAVQLLLMVMRRDDIQHLLADMQRFVSALSARHSRTAKRFGCAEEKTKHWCRIYERLAFIVLSFYFMMTAVYNIFYASHKTRSDDIGFFNDLYFFNVSQTPNRELCYIFSYVCHNFLVVVILAVDLLFYGLCYYLVTIYRELQDMLKHIETHGQQLTSVRTRRCSLIECIQLHQTIIRLTDTINDIFGHIIFVQFAYTSLGMCGLIFEVSYGSRSNLINMVISSVSALTEPFLFCLFGELVLTEANHLHSTVYEVHWHAFAIAEQRMIMMMLMQTQKCSGLAAYDYFHCNLETFTQIMSNVYTILAFLENMI